MNFKRQLETDLVKTIMCEKTPAKGTVVIAKKDIPAGTTILAEPAIAWQPLEDRIMSVCHHCMTEVPRWAVGCGEGAGGCSGLGYCSPKCREASEALHRVEHKVFLQARDIANRTKADITLIKLATRIIALRSLSEGHRVQFERGVMAMMGHEDECPQQWVDSITETAKLVMPLLPKPARLSAREFVKVCARINTNSHRQHHMFVPQRILGVGLYPLASLINHSCQPNCGFYNRGPTLYIRTLCDVKEGEELCYSYIDLYQSRSKRKAELLETKHFDCLCNRCSPPITDSVDRYLSGFQCPNKAKTSCDGLLVLPDGEGLASEKPVSCTAGCGETKTAGDLLKAQKRAEIMLTASQSLYYDQKRTSDSKTMLDKLLTGGYSPDVQLHPYHPTVFQAHVDSINVSDALGYTHMSIDHCEAVLRCAEAVLPMNHLETSNYYYYQGMLYSEQLAKRQGAGGDAVAPAGDAADDTRRAKEAFGKCHTMRSVWFGADHQCAIKPLEKMNAL